VLNERLCPSIAGGANVGFRRTLLALIGARKLDARVRKPAASALLHNKQLQLGLVRRGKYDGSWTLGCSHRAAWKAMRGLQTSALASEIGDQHLSALRCMGRHVFSFVLQNLVPFITTLQSFKAPKV
jgi:hypothetical protein